MRQIIKDMDALLQEVGLQKDSLDLLVKHRSEKITILNSENAKLRSFLFFVCLLISSFSSLLFFWWLCERASPAPISSVPSLPLPISVMRRRQVEERTVRYENIVKDLGELLHRADTKSCFSALKF